MIWCVDDDNTIRDIEVYTLTQTGFEAKGFADPIVNISENEVDVVINAVSVTDQQIAQIEDIVTRKAECDVSQVVITVVPEE